MSSPASQLFFRCRRIEASAIRTNRTVQRFLFTVNISLKRRNVRPQRWKEKLH